MTHTELLGKLVETLESYLDENFAESSHDSRAIFLTGMSSGLLTLKQELEKGLEGKEILWNFEARILAFLNDDIEEDTEKRDY